MRRARRATLGAMSGEVAPATHRPRSWRKRVRLTARLGRNRFAGDVLGALEMARKRLVGVLPADDVTGGQVVQLHGDALLPQCSRRGEGIDRQCQRPARVIGAEHVPTGLVVDDHELVAAAVEAVDPARESEPLGAQRDRAFDADRLLVRVDALDIAADHFGGALTPPHALLVVTETQADPFLAR